MAQALLGEETDNLDTLAKRLIERRETFSSKQVEELITRFEQGDKTAALNDNGWANFFFVRDGTSVFVLRACRDSGGWYVDVRRLDGIRRWRAGRRLVARN